MKLSGHETGLAARRRWSRGQSAPLRCSGRGLLRRPCSASGRGAGRARRHQGQCRSRCRSRSRRSSAAPTRSSAPTSPASSPTICSARACSCRSIPPPSSRRSAIADAVAGFANWRAINAQALVAGARGTPGRRQAQGRVPAVGRLRRPADGRPAVLHQPGQLAAGRAHHRRCDLRAADRREGLFRHAHRLRRRDRTEGQARQAPGDHGPGRRQCALPDQRRRPRADAALQPERQEITYMSYGAATSRASISSTSRPDSASSSATFPA